MKTYKRIPRKLIKSLLAAPCAAFGVGAVMLFLLQFFDTTWFFYLSIVLTLSIFVFLIYNAFVSENIRFEITDSGQLNHYRGRKLLNSYDLRVYDCGYHHVMAGGTTDRLVMRLTGPDGKNEIIDCEPVGERQFHEMFELIQGYSEVEPERLN